MSEDHKPTGVQQKILEFLYSQSGDLDYRTYVRESFLYVRQTYPDVTPAELAAATVCLIEKGLIGGTGFLFEGHE